jgi:hypothetical protein
MKSDGPAQRHENILRRISDDQELHGVVDEFAELIAEYRRTPASSPKASILKGLLDQARQEIASMFEQDPVFLGAIEQIIKTTIKSPRIANGTKTFDQEQAQRALEDAELRRLAQLQRFQQLSRAKAQRERSNRINQASQALIIRGYMY